LQPGRTRLRKRASPRICHTDLQGLANSNIGTTELFQRNCPKNRRIPNTIATVIKETIAGFAGIAISVNISVWVTAAFTVEPIRPDISNNIHTKYC
jgi:hypothetical protein